MVQNIALIISNHPPFLFAKGSTQNDHNFLLLASTIPLVLTSDLLWFSIIVSCCIWNRPSVFPCKCQVQYWKMICCYHEYFQESCDGAWLLLVPFSRWGSWLDEAGRGWVSGTKWKFGDSNLRVLDWAVLTWLQRKEKWLSFQSHEEVLVYSVN